MVCNLERLYDRYNQISEKYQSYVPIETQHTIIKLYCELKNETIDIENWLRIAEQKTFRSRLNDPQTLIHEGKFPQPKSRFFRIYILSIMAKSIPDSVYTKLHCSEKTIVDITMSIVLYYTVLESYKFSNIQISKTQKQHLIPRDDFYFTLTALKTVRWITSESEFEEYFKLFAKSVNEITETDTIGLFSDSNKHFIICIEDFVDYIIFELDKILHETASKEELDLYADRKGKLFEELVFSIVSEFFEETYHTLFYNPNSTQKMEIDLLLRSKTDMAILECKSGAFNTTGINKDSVIELKLKNASKKAYKTLQQVSDYISKNHSYVFMNGENKISGITDNPICIHVSMFSMDFISSNLHTLFPEYLSQNPILSISIEHLFAMLIDAKDNDKDIFEYFKKRKTQITYHPSFHFDNNELDLYYMLSNEKTFFNKLMENNLLNCMKPDGFILSSFHDKFNNELRPSCEMLNTLDSCLLGEILENGKSLWSLNKRYLENCKRYIFPRII